MAKVGAGDLREKVAFDEPVDVDDGYGGKARSWAQRYSCRAQFIYSRGNEAVEAARLEGRSIYKVRIRSCTASRAIKADWRMRDLRRLVLGDDDEPVSGIYNVREADAITDPQWVYIVVEHRAAN